MDIWDWTYRIDLILILIVGIGYALRELQAFWNEHVEHRAEMVKHNFDSAVNAAVAKIKGGADAAVTGVTGAVDGVRNTVADGLEATAEDVRPDDD